MQEWKGKELVHNLDLDKSSSWGKKKSRGEPICRTIMKQHGQNLLIPNLSLKA